jgi:hypothetical protein
MLPTNPPGAGLQKALNSRMKSSAVTCRAGVVLQSTPDLRWKV